KDEPVTEAEGVLQRFQFGPLLAVAGHIEPGGGEAIEYHLRGPHQSGDILDRPEIRDAADRDRLGERVAGGPPPQPSPAGGGGTKPLNRERVAPRAAPPP